jgi:hypothetical protein
MKRSNLFRHLFSAIALSGILFFAVSCSDQPAPGPMSPVNSGTKAVSPNKIRPVPRKSDEAAPARHSLAKGVYSDAQLIAFINQQPALSSGALKTILLSESPLSASVLIAMLNRTTKMSSGDLKAVLLASTPLPSEVQQEVQNKTLLSDGDLQTVMEAQAGFVSQFLGKTVSKLVTKKDGGTIWHGGHKIIFPKDALVQDAQASIAISSSDYIQVDFGPDGWFSKDVTVTISYKNVDLTGISESSLTLAWYDETTGQWIEIGGTVDTKKKTLTAKTSHFTQYTIATK